ncbi:hypothetical protein [Phytohabitans aurantiacus]|nr:hypothetical protein [Phytohabitans aurantiacus]
MSSGTYGTAVVAAFLDGFAVRTLNDLAEENWTLTAMAPAP